MGYIPPLRKFEYRRIDETVTTTVHAKDALFKPHHIVFVGRDDEIIHVVLAHLVKSLEESQLPSTEARGKPSVTTRRGGRAPQPGRL